MNDILRETEYHHLNRVMIKSDFGLCENKGTDQLRGYLYFGFIDSTIPLLSKSKFKLLVNFCGCRAQFVLDLVRNPEDRFSHDANHFSELYLSQ